VRSNKSLHSPDAISGSKHGQSKSKSLGGDLHTLLDSAKKVNRHHVRNVDQRDEESGERKRNKSVKSRNPQTVTATIVDSWERHNSKGSTLS
jgi:hypothetical protein